jgi:hypothetical protein
VCPTCRRGPDQPMTPLPRALPSYLATPRTDSARAPRGQRDDEAVGLWLLLGPSYHAGCVAFCCWLESPAETIITGHCLAIHAGVSVKCRPWQDLSCNHQGSHILAVIQLVITDTNPFGIVCEGVIDCCTEGIAGISRRSSPCKCLVSDGLETATWHLSIFSCIMPTIPDPT